MHFKKAKYVQYMDIDGRIQCVKRCHMFKEVATELVKAICNANRFDGAISTYGEFENIQLVVRYHLEEDKEIIYIFQYNTLDKE